MLWDPRTQCLYLECANVKRAYNTTLPYVSALKGFTMPSVNNSKICLVLIHEGKAAQTVFISFFLAYAASQYGLYGQTSGALMPWKSRHSQIMRQF